MVIGLKQLTISKTHPILVMNREQSINPFVTMVAKRLSDIGFVGTNPCGRVLQSVFRGDVVIVISRQAGCFSVMRLDKRLCVSDNLGHLRCRMKGASAGILGRCEWEFDWHLYADNFDRLSESDKRQIIRTLDDLNGVERRPISEMSDRWSKLVRV